jgi:hypothetical protein
MRFQVTVRYGGRRQRYHTYVVEAGDAREALGTAAENLPVEIATDVDLVELRIAVDPDRRAYVGEPRSEGMEPGDQRTLGRSAPPDT